ncbi:MAG: DUF2249 domain-containing protein [Ferruginibacter sp.]
MTINANTKIAGILKENPAALEAIISISTKFEKLRNPILRKLMAGRTSIAMASKIGGCKAIDFFTKLKPLGFEIDNRVLPEEKEKKQLPAFLIDLHKDAITELDVRPIISFGKDPLNEIIQKVKLLHGGQVLKIINSFYPEPLIHLLGKQGFESFADTIDDNQVDTYFYKTPDAVVESKKTNETAEGWDGILKRFEDNLQTIDVRLLAMPLPMMNILEALDALPATTALFVYHKRIPVFLLPELATRNFSYRIKEISDGEVNLLIYKE